MRPAGQNPHGRTRRQPQRGDGRRCHGVCHHGELAVTEPLLSTSVGSLVKRLVVLATIAALGACTPIPPPPPAPYHAVGNDPFWNLLIDEHDITFVQPDGPPIKQPTPRPINGFAA